MTYIARQLESRLEALSKNSPVIYLNGPRQAGKSTLVKHFSKEIWPSDYLTLDNPMQMAAAQMAPKEYLTHATRPLIIDEVQMAPDLFRALKEVIDERRSTQSQLDCQYLLTGSANIMGLPRLSDALVGRMTLLTLYPFAACEYQEKNQRSLPWLKRIFTHDFDWPRTSALSLHEAMAWATYPEISTQDKSYRSQWLDAYITTILQRDVKSLSEIQKLGQLPHLLRILATRAGGLLNEADIARDAGLSHMTTRNYRSLLKLLFLTLDVPAWHRQIGKRLVKAPKAYLMDTGMLCHLLGYESTTDVLVHRPELFGHVLENFVATELLKQMSFHDKRLGLYHYRTSDGKEVDFVIEGLDGRVVGIEVKAKSQISREDLAGLRSLEESCRGDFVTGVLLYGGSDVVQLADRIWAIPHAKLWQ